MRPTDPGKLRLLTLGSLSLRRDDGQVLASVITQPKRLALLVYLTCAKPRGLHQRDRVLGMFWPEMDQDRARAALSQSLYVLKKALGPDVIVTRGADQVGVNREVLWCDAVAFENELAQGGVDAAFALYHGDLLPGFFVSDAAGFEDWLERERRRLGGLAEAAAWELAARSEAAGDRQVAIAHARRAFDLSIHDESAIRRLLVLLDRAGDREGALAEYDRYAKKLRGEFDAAPAPETQQLVDEIRAREPHRARTPIEPVMVATTAGAEHARPVQRWGKRRQFGIASIVLAAVAVLVFGLWPRNSAEGVSGTRVAVLPFTHIGAGETAYLSDGVVDLLATRLDGAGDLRAVDPHAMLNRIDGDASFSRDPARARALAREFHAGYFLLGNVTQAGRNIHLRAVLYDHEGRVLTRAESTARGETELFTAVDDIARVLLVRLNRGSAPRLDQVAGLTTRSVPALKFYLEGEKAFRAGRFDTAAENFQAAIRADTTFALAYYRMALAVEQIGGDSLHQSLISSAVRHSSRLSEHDRRLVVAYAQFFQGSPDVAEGQYRHIVAQFPHDTEAWHQLGELVFHTAPARGRNVLEAWRPFERVIELDPGDVGALTHFARLAALRGDVARLREVHGSVARLEPGTSREAEVALLLAYATEPRGRQVALLGAFTDALSEEDLWNWAARIAAFTENPQVLVDAAAILARPGQPASARALSNVLRAQAFATWGRWRESRQEIERLARIDPITGSLLGGHLAVLPFAPAERQHLERVRADLRQGFPVAPLRSPVVGDLQVMPHKAMRHALLGLVELRLGNVDAALQQADSIDAIVSPNHSFGQASLLVRAAVAAHQNEAGALEQIEAFRRENYRRTDYLGLATFNNGLERYLRAELLMRAGRQQEAFNWFDSMNQDIMFNYFFFAPSHLRRAELLDRQGRRTDAMRHYARFLDLWRNADPESQDDVRRVAERLEAR